MNDWKTFALVMLLFTVLAFFLGIIGNGEYALVGMCTFALGFIVRGMMPE